MSVADHTDLGRNCNRDAAHHAVHFHLGSSGAKVRLAQIDLHVSHEGERPEYPRKNPLAFALYVRPPGDCSIPFGHEMVRYHVVERD
jgi:hypothetical protein